YARALLGALRRRAPEGWVERGLLLGALGGLAGFVAGGLVHYNFGDSEVVMVFYFIMGLALAAVRLGGNSAGSVSDRMGVAVKGRAA
ncbi:MAG TPA: hypothetical protein VM936_14130, partial [Pyrinomonadaceae bacterium]|nr:hypothetical protein [Pyrinomonadaceae bacterium]